MVRTQIQLTEEQSLRLKQTALDLGISVAELIRMSINSYLAPDKRLSDEELRQRAIAVAGRFDSGTTDVSEEHDRYLAEAYWDWHS